MKTLNEDIKNKKFKNVYLLHGDETFLLRSYKNQLKKAIVADDDMNYSYFEGKDIAESEIIDSAETMPFFGDKRLLIIENSGWFKSAHDDIAAYMDRINPSSFIIFVETEIDKRNKLYKKVGENGYVCEMKHPESKTMSVWAAGMLAKAGKKIRSSDMDLFLDRTGDDMERVRNELDKLIAYLGEREVVETADIEAVTTVTAQNRIFDMVRAITGGKRKEAMDLYEDLLALKEPPMRIIFLTAKQFSQLLDVKDMLARSMTKEEIAKILGIPPFAAEKMMRQVRGMDRSAILNYVKRCVELEEAIKTGDMPDRLAVELIICN